MKYLSYLLLLSGLFLFSCKSSNMATGKESNTEKYNSASNLTEYLTQIPGLMVSGEGPNARFKIRGINSINANSDPLFIVDGTPMAGGYTSVYSMIDVKDVKSARIVRGPDATFYGTRGAGGVVIIKTN
ncbi:MAG: TonB-dependent receptor plug domain-containing protein [Bacteroidia bacterium]|nr:TonB-dependent receptor plug domain-containing protein [Bacteroidia bacterium]